MSRPNADGLRRLAAELEQEVERIDRTVTEAQRAQTKLETRDENNVERLFVYGAAALLDTFYSGVEKTLARIAPTLNGGVPEGPAWHRRLLENMTLAIKDVRPAVLRLETARQLDPFLAFRHRFRNLYLFDLEGEPILALLDDLASTWSNVRADLMDFAAILRNVASTEHS